MDELPQLIEAMERAMRGVLSGDVTSAQIELAPLRAEGKGTVSASMVVESAGETKDPLRPGEDDDEVS